MSIDREDSKNAFRIAVSLLVLQFFNFPFFQLFLLLPKTPWKIPQMARGNKGPAFLCFKLLFQNVIFSLLLVQNGRFKKFP